jgi:hypothetical protein
MWPAVAKKVRTPKPPRASGAPRPVQAPQKRSGPSRTARTPSGTSERRWFWPLAAVATALVIVGAVLGIVLTRSSGPSLDKAPLALPAPIKWSSLPGMQNGPPPWKANGATLSARLPSLNLNQLGQEQLAFHIHQHLDIFVNGKHVAVPQAVGFGVDPTSGKYTYITELHTHNNLGILHVESAQTLRYVLGQFFGEWGVRLTGKCLGSFKGGCDNLQYYVNGKKQTGNPARLVLKNHQEIAVVVGPPPKKIPSSYDFGAHGI